MRNQAVPALFDQLKRNGLFLIFALVLFTTCSTQRADTALLLGCIGLLAVLYFAICNTSRTATGVQIILYASLLRLLLLFAPIQLSDDVYRFHWDGMKTRHSESPYSLPPNLDPRQSDWPVLYGKLNSPLYYSPYPPICQYIWALSANADGRSTLLKTACIVFDLLNLFFLYRILIRYKRSIFWLSLYAFNPLVLIEGVGQLHPEIIMLTGMLWAIDALQRERLNEAAMGLALAICTKLIPVLALFLLIGRLNWKRWMQLAAITGGLCIALYLPLLDWANMQTMGNGALLYFSHFEFNASFYYLIKSIYQYFYPLQSGRIVSQCLGAITLMSVVFFIRQKRWSYPQILLGFYSLYLLFSAVVHPWYILPLVAYGVLSGLWTPLVWSLIVYLSYTHYQGGQFSENYLLITIEYLVLLCSAALEYTIIQWKSKQLNSSHSNN